MKKQALVLIFAAGMAVSSALTAESLDDLRTRLAAMRNDQPTRIKVDVEVRHRGSAPLHLNREKRRGRAVVAYGPEGVKMIERRWTSTSTGITVWKKHKDNRDEGVAFLNETDAFDLVNPAGMMEFYLDGATLVSDEEVTWQNRAARLLVVRPAFFGANRRQEDASEDGGLTRLALEAKIWLDEEGFPLAMERSFEFRLTPALKATQQQTLTFQEVDGRLFVAESRETSSSTALAVLRGRDSKKMTVTRIQ